MSKLMRSISECMSEITYTQDHCLNAKFIFPIDFLGFNGHFPDKPILPGVCKIQAVVIMLEKYKNKQILLKEVVLAKFFSPVTYNEQVSFDLKESLEPNGQVMVKAVISGLDRKVAELHLRVAIIDK